MKMRTDERGKNEQERGDRQDRKNRKRNGNERSTRTRRGERKKEMGEGQERSKRRRKRRDGFLARALVRSLVKVVCKGLPFVGRCWPL